MTVPPDMPPHKKKSDASRASAFGTSVVEGMPSAVAACLVAIAVQDRSFAYCQVTLDGCLLSWGGALAAYGLQSLAVGDPVSEHLFFLEGSFPLAKPHELLSSVQIPQGLTMDVHLLLSSETPAVAADGLPANVPEQAEQASSPSCGWILLLDATAETQRQQQLQQKGNDLSLLRTQYAKLLRQTERSGLMASPDLLSESDTSVIVQSFPDLEASQQVSREASVVNNDTELSLRSQQDVSVLVIDLSDPIQSSSAQSSSAQSSSAQSSSAQSPVSDASLVEDSAQDSRTAFDDSTAAFSLITQFVTEEGGLVNHVLGTTMVVLFGVMPSLQSSAQQALSAANKVLRHYVPPLGKAGPSGPATSRRPGMAITTGLADTGLVYIHGSKMINAVGPLIQKAFVLRGRSRPDALIVDQTTLHVWQDNWESRWPEAGGKGRSEAENPLKFARFSQVLPTHHDYPDFRSQSLELYELTLTTSFGGRNRRDDSQRQGPTLSQPPPSV